MIIDSLPILGLLPGCAGKTCAYTRVGVGAHVYPAQPGYICCHPGVENKENLVVPEKHDWYGHSVACRLQVRNGDPAVLLVGNHLHWTVVENANAAVGGALVDSNGKARIRHNFFVRKMI